uniref:Uncharacterized protein n=1 Tax=Quercus lobata TaxID=97700 RepID=A0A7N2LMQ0_QUELO
MCGVCDCCSRLTEGEVGWVLPWDYGNVRFMGLNFGLWKLRGRLLIVEVSAYLDLLQLLSVNTNKIGRGELFLSFWAELPDSLYEAKKMIRDLGLDYVKIDACRNNCMLYWKENSNKSIEIK